MLKTTRTQQRAYPLLCGPHRGHVQLSRVCCDGCGFAWTACNNCEDYCPECGGILMDCHHTPGVHA